MPKISIFRFSQHSQNSNQFYFEKSDEQQILQGCDLDSDQDSAIPSVSRLSKYLFYIKQASKNFNAFRCLPSFNSVSLLYQNSMPLRMQWNSLETLSVCSKNACGANVGLFVGFVLCTLYVLCWREMNYVCRFLPIISYGDIISLICNTLVFFFLVFGLYKNLLIHGRST